jgi:hypothetical protein
MPKYDKTVHGFFGAEIMRHLVPIPNLLEAKRIGLILEDPENALSVINEDYSDLSARYSGRETTAMGLDPHDALIELLKLDRPLDPVFKMLTALGAARPENGAVYQRKEALSHVCAQTALRRGTLAKMPLKALVREKGVFLLRIEGSLFKNRKAARFARNTPYEKVIQDIAGCYEALDRYIGDARPAMGMADHPKLFVTAAGGMTGSQIYCDVFDVTRRFLSEQGREGPNMPGLLPFGPSGYRHILATHWLKETRDLLLAAEAIHDDPKTVYDHYARYAPEDLRAELARQWQTLRASGGSAAH